MCAQHDSRRPTIREQLLTSHYQPSAVQRVEIPKPGGGVRQLGIPTALDRFIQQAVLQVLHRRLIPRFQSTATTFGRGGARIRRCVTRNATCRVVGAGSWMSTW
jgi:RNA-directed DNA polymerase